MSRAILALMVAVMAVSACGIKRPLMRPKDIPAYEEKRARKMQKFQQQDAQQPVTKDTSPAVPVDVPTPHTEQPATQSLQDLMTPLPQVEQ